MSWRFIHVDLDAIVCCKVTVSVCLWYCSIVHGEFEVFEITVMVKTGPNNYSYFLPPSFWSNAQPAFLTTRPSTQTKSLLRLSNSAVTHNTQFYNEVNLFANINRCHRYHEGDCEFNHEKHKLICVYVVK